MKEANYIIKSHFLGDPANTTGPRCQFRRYVIDIYIKGVSAKQGKLKLKHNAEIMYYFGNTPIEGISIKVNANTERRAVDGTHPMPKENPNNIPFYGYDLLKTKDITVEWSSDNVINAKVEMQKIARILLCFGRWGMEYSEIEKYPCNDMISADSEFDAMIDGVKIAVSDNNYLGVVLPEAPQLPPVCPADICCGNLLSRFALFADAHIGVRYEWKNYDWLHSAFDNVKNINAKTPLDFVVWLGDNIDDGYQSSYQRDYDIYLEEIKRLEICDAENPIDGAKKGKIPNYELQGNHDPSPDTRFFRNKLWYTETPNGEKVGYISFFSSYGGYPLVNFNVAGNFNSYRSFGKISDETVSFIDQSIKEAKLNGAKHIVLFSHFGISQDVGAPILPESGLGKLENVCKKHNIKLYFSGHEHDCAFSHRMYGDIHDFDVSMLKDKHAVVEIYENACKITIYDTESQKIQKEELVALI